MDPEIMKMMEQMFLAQNNVYNDPAREVEDAMRKAEEEKKKPPVPLENVSPFMLIIGLQNQRAQTEEAGNLIRQTFIGDEKGFSSTPLSELRPIRLREMKARMRHKGRFLLCRIISQPARVVCVKVGIEDENGWGHMVSIYNFPHAENMSGQELDTLFPHGTVIAIREPYPKMQLTGSGSHIRVDSPSDIVFLDPLHPLLDKAHWTRPLVSQAHTEEEWKSLGDQHFKAKQYYAAVVAYSYGILENSNSVNHINLRLNRALAYLRLDYHDQALADCRAVLELEGIEQSSKVKALYRAGLAAYGQADYDSASDSFKACLELDSNLKDAKDGIERCIERKREKATGIYNWVSLFKQSRLAPAKPDVAEYVGSIELTSMAHRGGGRGIVATQDIKIGTLLVVSKAIASAFKEDYHSNDLVRSLNCLTKIRETSTQYSLIQRTVAKVASSASRARQIYDLYAGNSFINPPNILPNEDSSICAHPMTVGRDIDIARIEGIASFNSFNISGQTRPAFEMKRQEEDNTPSALFTLPSYFNHSCDSNARWTCYGDILVIRAHKDISQGEEVTVPYAGGHSYDERKKSLSKHFAKCGCRLCEADRSDGLKQCRERDRLLSEAKGQQLSVARARRLVEEVKKTYTSSHGGPHLALADAHHLLATILGKAALSANGVMEIKLWKESAREEMTALECYGMVLMDKGLDDIPLKARSNLGSLPISESHLPYNPTTGVMISLSIVASLFTIGVRWRAKRWLKVALWIENKAFGGGMQLFRVRYVDIVSGYGPEFKALLDEMEESGWTP